MNKVDRSHQKIVSFSVWGAIQGGREYFKDKVYNTVIPRNVRLSEAPSHGVPVLIYDKTCPGSKSYFSFTDEFLNKEFQIESVA